MAWGAGSRCLPGMGRKVELPQLLPIKQSWHFRARHRRWLPALEVSVWPLSQHCLPSLSPLTSADQSKGPNRPIVILPSASMGPFRGFGTSPPWRALPPPPPGYPWPQPLPVWVGGLAVVKAAGSQANITEGWIVDRGHRNVPHVTGLQGTLPTLCPALAPTQPKAAGLPRGLHLRTAQQCLPAITEELQGDSSEPD